MKEKPRQRKYHVKLKSGSVYTIDADYMRYEEESNGEGILYFHKKISRKKNPDTKDGSWIVTFVKDKDVDIVGLESFIVSDEFPVSDKYIKQYIIKTGISILSAMLIALVARKIR
ncbi:MAG: hypothetical protein IKW90_15060 [Lachnospiraceae bacterium]|nr:hypothetical protein [Lachnospiraceae bacterium]